MGVCLFVCTRCGCRSRGWARRARVCAAVWVALWVAVEERAWRMRIRCDGEGSGEANVLRRGPNKDRKGARCHRPLFGSHVPVRDVAVGQCVRDRCRPFICSGCANFVEVAHHFLWNLRVGAGGRVSLQNAMTSSEERTSAEAEGYRIARSLMDCVAPLLNPSVTSSRFLVAKGVCLFRLAM